MAIVARQIVREASFERDVKNSRRYEKRDAFGRLQGCLADVASFSYRGRRFFLLVPFPAPPLLLQLLFILSRSICIIFKFKYTKPAELPPPSPPHLSPLLTRSLPPLLSPRFSFSLGADGGQLATRCLVTPHRNCRPRENNAEVDTIT